MAGKIKISPRDLEIIVEQIEMFGTIETGGVLMGKVIDNDFLVERISGPGPNAIHEETYFKADANYIDMFIDTEYARSGGKCRYLGEWHTHPQISPYPSDVDIDSLKDIAEDSDEFAILLIVGAVDFDKEEFLNQVIAIIRFRGDDKFYKMEVVLES